jgi:hypothetical protein
MPTAQHLAERVLEVAEAIREGSLDPLEFRLTDAYQDLRDMAAGIDSRLDIDEMLNEILRLKVNRVEELARILASPEIYVERIKGVPVRRLAKMMQLKQPVTFSHLEKEDLDESFTRIGKLLEAMAREPEEESIPKMSAIPNGYSIETEDAVFLEDLLRFLDSIPSGKRVPLNELVESQDFDVFLKRFLYAVVLISKGDLQYDQETRVVWKKV